MLITDLPADQRPRERLQSKGAHALTDAELLAIVLRTGIQGKNAIQLGRDLIERFGSMARLLAANPEELAELKGMGPSKCCLLLAVVELARRGLAEQLRAGPLLQSPQAVAQFLRLRLHGLPSETFLGLFLDVQGRMIACEEMFRGTLTRTHVYPREIVRRALAHNAAAMIFAHNHPSGTAEPSKMDKTLTNELKRVLACIEVTLLDHLIVSDQEVWSFQQHGLC
jgi:DNA repair protein RadC